MATRKNFSTLQVGQTYKDREGILVDITGTRTDSTSYPFQATVGSDGEGRTYTKTGRYYGSDSDPKDLMTLVGPTETAPKPKTAAKKPVKKAVTKQTITVGELRNLYKVSTCGKWRTVILSYMNAFDGDDVVKTINQSDLDMLLREGSDSQKRAVKALGITIAIEDNNPMPAHTRSTTLLRETNQELFGGTEVLNIASGVAPNNELQERSVWVIHPYKVRVHKTASGQILEFYKP